MDLSSLHKAINDLEAERKRIEQALTKLRELVAELSRQELPIPKGAERLIPGADGDGLFIVQDRSYAGMAYAILKQRGPMHIRQLLPLIAHAKGLTEVDRASVESSLHKAMQAGPWKDKIYKPGRGIYAARD